MKKIIIILTLLCVVFVTACGGQQASINDGLNNVLDGINNTQGAGENSTGQETSEQEPQVSETFDYESELVVYLISINSFDGEMPFSRIGEEIIFGDTYVIFKADIDLYAINDDKNILLFNDAAGEWEEAIEPGQEVAKIYGIVFLGYAGEEAISEPFAYISDEQFKTMESVTHDGDEYFLIVPDSPNAFIEIFDTDENGNVGNWIYRSSVDAAVPVLLRCNVSDVRTNTQVRVESNGTVVTFAPAVDLMSGTAVIAEGGYELLPIEQSGAQNTDDFYLQAIRTTIGDDYIMGRSFMRGDDDIIYGEICAVYAIGTDTPEKFTVEEWFAVNDSGIVYYYNYNAGEWLGFSTQG